MGDVHARPDVPRRGLKTSELVALEIVRDIVERSMRPGDKLPQEQEMLAHYQVSRSSLREALRMLETQGLILIRPGRGTGTVVGKANPKNLGSTLSMFFHMAGVNYDDLLNAWLITEPLLAEMAARNPDADLKQELLGPFTNSSKRCAREQRTIPAGLAFHDAVAFLSGNRTLEFICMAMGFIVSDHMLLMKDRDALEDFIVDDHSRLAKAIINGKPAQARQLMEQHVRNVVEDFKAYWPRKVGERIRWR